MDPVRIGALGAARITPMALLRPARALPEARVAAVAARDPERARRFAARHDIPLVHESYEALLADPELDAIYNPLPNSHHCEWTLRALDAGKHVLCEKPLTANAEEAERVAEAARRTGLVVMEAFHWRYHPLAERMREVLASGVLGELEHIETAMCIPLIVPGDIRYRLDLAGGATMDVGCYAIHMLRTLAGAEPEVLRAEARLASPGVDRYMRADFRFGDGRTGRMTCALLSATPLRISARARGARGELRVWNPIGPQFWHRLSVRTREKRTTERLSREPTYVYQLRAFCAALREAAPIWTPPSDSVANMRVIDAVYRGAGLPLRGTGS